jgi:hypothetical protein
MYHRVPVWWWCCMNSRTPWICSRVGSCAIPCATDPWDAVSSPASGDILGTVTRLHRHASRVIITPVLPQRVFLESAPKGSGFRGRSLCCSRTQRCHALVCDLSPGALTTVLRLSLNSSVATMYFRHSSVFSFLLSCLITDTYLRY